MSFFDSLLSTVARGVSGAEKDVGGFFNNLVHAPTKQPEPQKQTSFFDTVVNNSVKAGNTLLKSSPVSIGISAPEPIKNVAMDLGKGLVQSAYQAPIRVGAQLTGNDSYQPTGLFQTALLGNKPISNLTNYGKETTSGLGGLTGHPGAGNSLPTALALPIGALAAFGDVTPLNGGGGAKVVESLSKANKVEDVIKILTGAKDLGLDAKTISQIAPTIAKTADKSQIKDLLKGTSTKNEAAKALGTQAPGAEEAFYKATGATVDQAKTLAQQSKDALTGNLARTGHTPVAPIAGDIHPAVATAANDLAKFYNTVPDLGPTAHDLVRTTNGYIEAGKRIAGSLGDAITKALPEASDRLALRDLAEGAVKAEDVSPAVRALHEALQPLTKAGFDVRQAVDGTFKAAQDYSTRVPVSKLKDSVGGAGTGILGKIKSVNQLFDNTSKFSQGRQVGKFVDSEGKAVFGSPQSLGFSTVASKANTYVKDGAEFTKVPTTASEIEKSGVIAYEKDAAKTQALYHQDTTALKVRNEAMHQLQTDPKYGLSADPVIPKGNIEITKIPELAGWHGPRKTVNELERSFQAYDKGGLLQRTWTGITRPLVQAIVLNPLFHGTNQLAQAFIAAGNIPIVEGGKVASGPIGGLKQLGNVFKILADPAAREAAARGYLEAGGHIPKYGSDTKGFVYNLLAHASLGKYNLGDATKLNSRTMSLIEETLRSSTWQASVNAGMDAKEAAKNIDKYMGDKALMSRNAQNFGLFLHYLKTTAGALYTAGRHPVKEAGATADVLVVLAATLAVQQGWREFTGNPDATVRFPGEVGTAKSILEAPGQLAQGHAPSILTNHINPAIMGIAQQVFNKDIHTGADIVPRGADISTGVQDRLANALGVVAPINQAQQVQSGYKTPAQIAQAQLGLYTPGTPKTKGGKVGRPKGSTRGGRGSVKGRLGGVGKVSKASRGTKARKGTGRIKTVKVSTKSRAIKALRRI